MQENEEVAAELRESAVQAVRLLVEVMNDEEADRKLRVDIAKDILSRAYGKGLPEAAAETAVQLVLEGELERYAR